MANFINKYNSLSAYEADENKDYPNVSLVAGELTIVETPLIWKASGLTTGNTTWVIYETQDDVANGVWIKKNEIPNNARTVVVADTVEGLGADRNCDGYGSVIPNSVSAVTIGSGVTDICNDALCSSNLREVIFTGEKPSLTDGIFSPVPSVVYVPNEYYASYYESDPCEWFDSECDAWCMNKIQPISGYGQPYPSCNGEYDNCEWAGCDDVECECGENEETGECNECCYDDESGDIIPCEECPCGDDGEGGCLSCDEEE